MLLALAATAHHAVADHPPELIIGHGVLGRLLARITVALGHPAPIRTIVDVALADYAQLSAAAGTADTVFMLSYDELLWITGGEPRVVGD